MHYAWEVARNGMNPTKVPAYTGKGGPINIDWVHRDGAGKVDRAASKAAAEEMVVAYQMAYNAALVSNHNFKDAIDVTISWTGNLSIKDGNGKTVVIKSTPRNGADNTELHAVGATYNVIKLVKDRPHWSRTGN